MDYDRNNLTLALCNAEYRSTAGQVTGGTIGITADGQVTTQSLPVQVLQEQSCALDANAAANWEESDLVAWLDERIPHPDISSMDMVASLSRLILNLTSRTWSLKQLVVDKYHLLNAVAAALKKFRKGQKNDAFQKYLSPEFSTPLTVLPHNCFRFGENYPVNHRYTGSIRFNKHLYNTIGDMNDEEAKCAQILDAHPQVDSWVRNLEKRELDSFWLQTSTDKFYPDFVCKLTDGRILVVEYKGHHLYSNTDSTEKRTIGQTWAKLSNGSCLFLMTDGMNLEKLLHELGF
jgi:type III restriction enzyme